MLVAIFSFLNIVSDFFIEVFWDKIIIVPNKREIYITLIIQIIMNILRRLGLFQGDMKEFVKDIGTLESLQGIEKMGYSDAIYKKLKRDGENEIVLNPKNSIILWIPHNDGMPTCPFNFYNGDEVVLTNRFDFTELNNLPTLLHQVTDIMTEAYQAKTPVFSFDNFGLKLKDELIKDYSGESDLVYLKLGIDPKALKEREKATNYCTNQFLDRFMGWNYGDLIRQDSELEDKLITLTQQLLSESNRVSDKGMAFEVCYRTNDTKVNNFYNFELAKKD